MGIIRGSARVRDLAEAGGEASGGKRGRRCPAVATLLTSTDWPLQTCPGR